MASLKVGEIKVSGTGWLCVKMPRSDAWMPVCQLTPEQIRNYNEVRLMFDLMQDARNKLI